MSAETNSAIEIDRSVGDFSYPEQHAYGCWRFKYSNGDVWSVTPEVAEKVADRGENTNVLARYNDESSNIAIAEKRFGQGRVLAFTFPADEEWTNLPQVGSANIILHLQMCEYLAVNDSVEGAGVGDGVGGWGVGALVGGGVGDGVVGAAVGCAVGGTGTATPMHGQSLVAPTLCAVAKSQSNCCCCIPAN